MWFANITNTIASHETLKYECTVYNHFQKSDDEFDDPDVLPALT